MRFHAARTTHKAVFTDMAKLEIKTESPPERCEICHKSDCFDPNANFCSRCSNICTPALITETRKRMPRLSFFQMEVLQADLPWLFRTTVAGLFLGAALGWVVGPLIIINFYSNDIRSIVGIMGGSILGLLTSLIYGLWAYIKRNRITNRRIYIGASRWLIIFSLITICFICWFTLIISGVVR